MNEFIEKEISKGNIPSSVIKLYNNIKSKLYYSHIEDEDRMYCAGCGVVSEELNEDDLCKHCDQ